ncbi:MAG: hypothetical protein V1787_02085 [Candidatus Micrarchaeota archaeon]
MEPMPDFDTWFSLMSLVFFGMLTLYSARTYLFFRESSLAQHLRLLSVGLFMFTLSKAIQLYQYTAGTTFYQLTNTVELAAALFLLGGVLDFKREFMKFKWLKEMEAAIRNEKRKPVV